MPTKKLLKTNTGFSPSGTLCSSPIFKTLGFFLLLAGAWFFFPSINAGAMTDIRVGLVAQYKDKDVITVYNKRVVFGYATQTKFEAGEAFYGESGFSFEPDVSSYAVKSAVYKTYDEARKAIGKTNTTGSIPVMKGPGTWQLYEKTDGADASKREHLIKVSFGKNSFLIDAIEGSDSKKYSPYPQIRAVSAKSDSNGRIISLGTRSYRGRIEIIRSGNKLTAVNIISIEAYLCGVVTCEMDKSYETEALKAQAVVARSYALSKTGFSCKGTLGSAYSLVDTTASQEYRGVGGETDESIMAVSETVGEVIYNGDNIVETFYFSTSGGSTESGIEVWGINSPIYNAKPDLYELRPEKAPWVITYTLAEAGKLLRDAGYDVGSVRSIKEAVVTASGRVSSLKVTGSSSNKTIGLSKAQSIFGLPSSKYKVVVGGEKTEMPYAVNGETVEKLFGGGLYAISESGTLSVLNNNEQLIAVCDNNFVNFPMADVPNGSVSFFGMGWGHGIGLSQSGAQGLAKNGYDYQKIIHYYFDNIRIGRYRAV